jgi:hypothetical protein
MHKNDFTDRIGRQENLLLVVTDHPNFSSSEYELLSDELGSPSRIYISDVI